mmetsp:Transcript_33240/g.51547  ORF Transcript_33240/g.51547 Transcript_33240/m.51547 type:complete len:216 (+) Transcript_33240:57-704(+)
MEEPTKDVEAPEVAEQKGDELSLDDTKSVDTTSERDSEDSVSGVVEKDVADVQESRRKRYKTIALLTVIVVITGLAAGLGFGLTNEKSSFSSVLCNFKGHWEEPSEPGSASSSGDGVDTVDPGNPEESLDSELPELPSKPVKDPVEGDAIERMQWPELVGMPDTDAIEYLQQLYGDTYEIVTVPFGHSITMDFRTDRIILYLDESGKVMLTPQVG